jgi:hypothetical protein
LKVPAVQDYPELCTQMTAVFNNLSATVLSIKVFIICFSFRFQPNNLFSSSFLLQNEVVTRKEKANESQQKLFNQLLTSIQQLQTEEKEKLLVNASIHLDKMQIYLPNVQTVTGGKNNMHESYLQKKIDEIEQRINEILEEFQSLKIDFSELESE